MKKTLHALVPLADGFEELEAVAILDVLRRAGVETTAAAVSGTPTVTGSHQLTLTADLTLTTAATRSWDAVVLPGGLPGSRHLAESPLLLELLRQTAAAGGVVAALCAAPLALHAAGLLEGRRFTCYPAQHPNIATGTYTGNRVETDGQLVTGKAAGAAVEFAFAVLRALNLNEPADQLAAAMFTPTEPVSA